MLADKTSPFSWLPDGGLHEMACAFQDAAEKLEAELEKQQFTFNAHLPICFLYRHAIELHLKSSIAILHRVYEPFDKADQQKAISEIPVRSAKPNTFLTNSHSLKDLGVTLQEALVKHREQIYATCKYGWTIYPNDQKLLDELDTQDRMGDFFRYPWKKPGKNAAPGESMADALKGGFIEIRPEDLERDDLPPGKIIREEQDENGQPVRLSVMIEPLQKERASLRTLAKEFHGFAFGLKMNLIDGLAI